MAGLCFSLPDVVLIPFDAKVTSIDLHGTASIQTARGSVVMDGHGSRQATLFFPPEATVKIVLPDGSIQPINALSVRLTEYTVGPSGPAAMPAELPPSSAYTYCVELSVDEAESANAKELIFSEPISFYVDNYLGFPTGGQVPVGSYDRSRGVWIPENDGRIVEILRIENGLAQLDTNGDGNADNGISLNVSQAERAELAFLYSTSQSLWRVPVNHFSPFDCNWPSVLAEDAHPPNVDKPEGETTVGDNPVDSGDGWGRIEFQNQLIKESLHITGTPHSLNYASDRIPGRKAACTLQIPVSGVTIPNSLREIELEIKVAGKRMLHTFAPEPNLDYIFTWDGSDVFGRFLQGEIPITIRIGYKYQMFYAQPPAPPSFGRPSGKLLASNVPSIAQTTLWQEHQTHVSRWDARGQGLGGWTFDIHHAYSPLGGTLYLGNGQRRQVVIIKKR